MPNRGQILKSLDISSLPQNYWIFYLVFTRRKTNLLSPEGLVFPYTESFSIQLVADQKPDEGFIIGWGKVEEFQTMAVFVL